MGCTHWFKPKEPEVAINRIHQDGFKNLFYATTEFDLSRSENEDEEDNFSLASLKNNHQQLTNGAVPPSIECNDSTNNISSPIANSILDNKLAQTGV